MHTDELDLPLKTGMFFLISTPGRIGQRAFQHWSKEDCRDGHRLQGWAQDFCQQRWGFKVLVWLCRQCPFKNTRDSTVFTCVPRYACVRLLWTFYPRAEPRPGHHGDSWLAYNSGCGARAQQSSGWDERGSHTGGFMLIINLDQKWVELTDLSLLLFICHPKPSLSWDLIELLPHWIHFYI